VSLKKIEFSSMLLEKFFSLICPRLSFLFPCVPLPSRKHTFKSNFHQICITKQFLKTNNSQKRFF
jgi:hypothetical protein